MLTKLSFLLSARFCGTCDKMLKCGELAQNMRRADICCSQSDTSFYQSVFAEHVTKSCDNEDTIEEDVRETNMRKFLEVTDTDL